MKSPFPIFGVKKSPNETKTFYKMKRAVKTRLGKNPNLEEFDAEVNKMMEEWRRPVEVKQKTDSPTEPSKLTTRTRLVTEHPYGWDYPKAS